MILSQYEKLKAKKRCDEEKIPIVKVLQLANKDFISTDELLEALYIDKEQLLEEILNTPSVQENTLNVSVNTTNVSEDTHMESRKYMLFNKTF